MIIIIDYGMGNQGSILNRLKRMSVAVSISSRAEDIAKAEKLILPGVGFFASGMENLKKYDLLSVLREKVIGGKTPILGICLGMQLFTNCSEEGNADGLDWIDAETRKFNFDGEGTTLCIPHIGWNSIELKRDSPIVSGLVSEATYYFTHSYYVDCHDADNVVATTHYGYDFAAVIQRENIFGTQFHPEKSHKSGIALLRNFVRNV